VRISIEGTDGNYWIIVGNTRHGPFATILDASWTSIDIVTDRINAIAEHRVFFFAPKGM
jgi:hypothetical protein